MSTEYFELRDVQRDGVRKACIAIEQALARLPAAASAETDELRARWAELVAVLALEPARVLRECPVCKHVGMFEATRCGNCWAKLAAANVSDAVVRSDRPQPL